MIFWPFPFSLASSARRPASVFGTDAFTFAEAIAAAATADPPAGAVPSRRARMTCSFATAIRSPSSFTSQDSKASMLLNFIFREITTYFEISMPSSGTRSKAFCSSFATSAPSALPVASPAVMPVRRGMPKPCVMPLFSASSYIGASDSTRSMIWFRIGVGTTAPLFAVVCVNAVRSSSVISPSRCCPSRTQMFFSHAVRYSGEFAS